MEGGAISPLALVVLDTAKPSAGRFPDGWELKVRSGEPDVSSTKEGDAVVPHFKSVKPSFRWKGAWTWMLPRCPTWLGTGR